MPSKKRWQWQLNIEPLIQPHPPTHLIVQKISILFMKAFLTWAVLGQDILEFHKLHGVAPLVAAPWQSQSRWAWHWGPRQGEYSRAWCLGEPPLSCDSAATLLPPVYFALWAKKGQLKAPRMKYLGEKLDVDVTCRIILLARFSLIVTTEFKWSKSSPLTQSSKMRKM